MPGVADRTSLSIEATYDVDVEISVGTGEIAVQTVIGLRNESGGPIDRVELNAIAARLGRMTISGTTVDGLAVTASVDDQTITVPLGGILPDGASTNLELTYRATLKDDLANSDWLFSRAGGTIAMYRWIPWISRAIPFDRPNFGDPFETSSSPRVQVRVTTDSPMVLASPGSRPTVEGLITTFEVTNVRDVAIVLAPDFVETTGTVDGVEVRSYTRPGGLEPARVMAQAERALSGIAGQLEVPYPWATFTIAETAGGYGMESPEAIWLPRQTLRGNLAYLIHHETAHQWFYGLVGNDQQAEPFADEAAADFVARTVLGTLRGSRCVVAPLDRAITRYSASCYYEVVYIQGGEVLDAIRRHMGDAAFWAALRGYLEDHRFGIGGTRALLQSLVDGSTVDLGPILRARFPSLFGS
ncbi:MAG: hypothetical protein HYX54_08605 [Chloroflexi bacterium]|nr:hypothetical protein [Chloroflexota bacterium]